jgi:hypothetical protein
LILNGLVIRRLAESITLAGLAFASECVLVMSINADHAFAVGAVRPHYFRTSALRPTFSAKRTRTIKGSGIIIRGGFAFLVL